MSNIPRQAHSGNWQIGPDGRIRLVTTRPREPAVNFTRLSGDELLRQRVKSVRKSRLTLQKAKNLVLETADPEHAIDVIEPLLSSTRASILRSAMQSRAS